MRTTSSKRGAAPFALDCFCRGKQARHYSTRPECSRKTRCRLCGERFREQKKAINHSSGERKPRPSHRLTWHHRDRDRPPLGLCSILSARKECRRRCVRRGTSPGPRCELHSLCATRVRVRATTNPTLNFKITRLTGKDGNIFGLEVAVQDAG